MKTNQEYKVKVIGSGSYLPGTKITIDEVDRYLGPLNNAPRKIQSWMKRMKILMKEMLEVDYYHFAIDPETREFTDDNISMSVKAARMAIKSAEIRVKDIDLIAYGSAHQDQMPTASVRIQEALGLEECSEISIHANCTSAYKAFITAYDMIRLGRYKTSLVVSSNISSSELRAEYYNQPLIKKEEVFLRYFLSDGAGAIILQSSEADSGLMVENAYMESVGGKKPAGMLNKRPAYWMNPKEEYEKGFHHLSQMFNEKLGTHFNEEGGSIFYKGLQRMIEKYKVDVSQIRFFQVNFPSRHISEMVMEECERLGISKNTLYTKISSMGYVGPPMVFICIDKIMREEQLNKNDLILSFVSEVSKFMQAGFTLKKH
ncbi:MAG: 3-oxoacyl-ACP synthase III family protein [Bacteroidales bacterium]|nr:3-oxoacyl-ACP synthase III family protein [Bacteroidales bacterium]